MDITIHPRKLQGTIEVIPSKSLAHRYLICASFSDNRTELVCPQTNRDIEATADCLRALGAEIRRTDNGYMVSPFETVPETAALPCRDSGSTLRFLLPIVGALGVDATFHMEGRLPQRPLSPLWEEMERMGCTLSRPAANTIRCRGKLRAGDYAIDGSVSSQFITGLLFALSLLPEPSQLTLTGKIESLPYINMTIRALEQFRVKLLHKPDRYILGCIGTFSTPGMIDVEGDWSNGAFWLAATELGSGLTVTNLSPSSPQGDSACAYLLPGLREHSTISVANIPDLVPILSVVAAANRGAVFTNIRRLRIKESDRVASTIAMLESLGGRAEATEDTLTVYGTGLKGGIVDAVNDHRIAMSAAIAATICSQPVTILGAQCVEKSYPSFWEDYARLGGNYELNLR